MTEWFSHTEAYDDGSPHARVGGSLRGEALALLVGAVLAIGVLVSVATARAQESTAGAQESTAGAQENTAGASAGSAGTPQSSPAIAPGANVPDALRDVGWDQKLGEQLPLDLTFVNETEEEIALGSFFGERPVILTLVYYECPMLCSLVLNGMAGALKAVPFELGDDYEIVTVSFDAAEKPRLARINKKNYLEAYAVEGGEEAWHFLVGGQDSIDRLTESVGFRYAYDAETDQYAHTAGLVVATPEGKIARYFFGVEFSPRDLRLGLVEASEEQIGSVVDQVLLYCYQYNPVSGTYAATALTIVRAGGVVTILVLVVFLILMLRRDRLRARRQVGAVS
jgi:protein SCO1/2